MKVTTEGDFFRYPMVLLLSVQGLHGWCTRETYVLSDMVNKLYRTHLAPVSGQKVKKETRFLLRDLQNETFCNTKRFIYVSSKQRIDAKRRRTEGNNSSYS